MESKKRLFRVIIPAFPEVNVFSRIARRTTALGPIMVATSANKLNGWCVEVIDENNYRGGPRDKQGLPDHQILQEENPATVVGFACGLSSTMERVWELARFYQNQGVKTIAGGWHTHYLPEESLKESLDLVVHDEAEIIIQQVLKAIEGERSFSDIPGISFWENGVIKTNLPVEEKLDLDDLPFPDFGLIRFAKLNYYPIGRTRGCSTNCEFCSVRGKPHWACAQHLFKAVQWLVETRRARDFFIVDDRSEEDRQGTLEFFRLIAKKYGRFLRFTVQIRLEAAEDTELLKVMEQAGVKVICVGFESPIDEDLRSMRKGYKSVEMIQWTKIFHRFGFFVHAMFIFGYPGKEKTTAIGACEKFKRLKKFIRQCHLDTIQVLRPVPLPGTDLRARLEGEGRLFPIGLVPWSRYDGSYICFRPNNMTLEELQELPTKIMRWFYNPLSFVRIPFKTLIFPFDYLIRGWQRWYRGWRNNITKYGGHLLVKRWRRHYQNEQQAFLKKLEKAH